MLEITTRRFRIEEDEGDDKYNISQFIRDMLGYLLGTMHFSDNEITADFAKKVM